MSAVFHFSCPSVSFQRLAQVAVLLLSAEVVQAQGLNDTGQTQCDNGRNVLAACTRANAGNTTPMPGQDGGFGRDVAEPAKVGGGAAGFDFTKVCMNGTLNCATAANTGGTPAATEWACSRDNVTNLVWSLQTQTATWNAATVNTYPDAGHNTASRCGFNSGWRLPTRRELLSIVHRGLATAPTVDVNYFPATQSNWYLTSDTYAPHPVDAWVVYFLNGATGARTGASTGNKTDAYFVRLVHSGQ